jgi:hypothetical protein
MKYLLTLWGDETGWADATPEQFAAVMAEYEEFDREATEAGVMLGGEGLQDSQSATTISLRGGKRLVTDGPFVETKEELGGYYLLEADDLDAAIELAARIPAARSGAVEVRPVVER